MLERCNHKSIWRFQYLHILSTDTVVIYVYTTLHIQYDLPNRFIKLILKIRWYVLHSFPKRFSFI